MIRIMVFCSVIFIVVVSFTSGCNIEIPGFDHTNLEGNIIMPMESIKIGDRVALYLEVPEELSGIYRTMWEVKDDMGDIIEGENLVEELTKEEILFYFGTPYINQDRVALFTAKKKGKCKIFVEGFYKQTNPQNITSIEFEIE